MKRALYNVDGISVPIDIRSYEEMHGISMCCIALNEEKEIAEFLKYHKPYVDEIILIDGGSIDRTVEFATGLADTIRIRKFDGHYSNQANRAVELASKDWILLLDCDERLEPQLLKKLRTMTDQDEYDCYAFPRLNYIDGVIKEDDYPDYQERLYRAYCRRVRPVHGEVVGYKKKKLIEPIAGSHIIHDKTAYRHSDRNTNYQLFNLCFKHELGEPGSQMKETFEAANPTVDDKNFTIKQ